MKRLSPKFGKTRLLGEVLTNPWRRTIMFAGHETTAKTVSSSARLDSGFISTRPVVDARPLGARKEASCSRKTSSRDSGNVEKNQGQGRQRFHRE